MRYHVEYMRISWRNSFGDKIMYVMVYGFK